MLANSVQYYIRSILQISKLNREKFVNNKKKYNMMVVKNRNHNMIIKRNFGSYSGNMPPNKDPNEDSNEYMYAIIGVFVGGYLMSKKINKNIINTL
jgi:hypothetical protein